MMSEQKPLANAQVKPLSAFAKALQKKNKVPQPKEVSFVSQVSSAEPIDEFSIMDPRIEELRKLAEEAVKTADAVREASVKATIAKNALFVVMKSYNVKQITIPGRDPVKITVSSGKKTATKGELLRILGPEVGEQTWKSITVSEGKESLTIPQAGVAEGNTEE